MNNKELHQELLHLVSEGLVIAKRHPVKPWTMFKYHNKVFYNNLWYTSPALLEARGIVIADDGEVIQRPFHKCFNIGENNTEFPVGDYDCYRKVNGFMAAASNGIITTTGSFHSDFQNLAYEWVGDIPLPYLPSYTSLFEICDSSDPHIVEESEGVYLLSIRCKDTGDYLSQSMCDDIASDAGIKRPEKADYDISAKHEGWMFYDVNGTPLSKCKTPHYLSKKALMRMGKAAVNRMFEEPVAFHQRLDEEFYDIFDTILTRFSKGDWLQLGEQGRRMWIENYFTNCQGDKNES